MTRVTLATSTDLAGRLTGLLAKVVATTNLPVAGLPTIDGYQTVALDVVLLTGQTSTPQNGPWIVGAGAWSRPQAFANAAVLSGGTVVVTGGTANAGTVWSMTTTGTVTVDSTPQTWVNAPVAGLNAALAAKADGAATATALAGKQATIPPGIYAEYLALAANPDLLIFGAITRDANGAATSAPVVWPNAQPGTYTATTVSTAFPGSVDAYTITYGSPVTKTYTQPAVTRNTSGAVTTRPAITVA